MKHAGTAFLVVMLFSTLGLWGIAQQKNGAYASRLRDLEARHAKFEEDQRVFYQQGEKSQRRIATLEVEKADLTQAVEELKTAVAERDDLRKQLTVRTTDLAGRTKERNELRSQLDARTQERDTKSQELKQFSQELQALLGRMENAIATTAPRAGATEAIPASRRTE
jgi:septal ring factor EnvC (AmiA/AmiB activator)